MLLSFRARDVDLVLALLAHDERGSGVVGEIKVCGRNGRFRVLNEMFSPEEDGKGCGQ